MHLNLLPGSAMAALRCSCVYESCLLSDGSAYRDPASRATMQSCSADHMPVREDAIKFATAPAHFAAQGLRGGQQTSFQCADLTRDREKQIDATFRVVLAKAGTTP